MTGWYDDFFNETCKVYLSGPMTGYQNFNREAFDAVATRVRDVKAVALSPVVHIETAKKNGYLEALRADFVMICGCTHMLFLPDWEGSKGAVMEWTMAQWLQIPRFYLTEEMNAIRTHRNGFPDPDMVKTGYEQKTYEI